MSAEVFNFKEMYHAHMDEDPELNKELGDIIERKYKAIYKFYDDHGLSRVQLTNQKGEIVHDPVHEDELTEEGLEFRYTVRHWSSLKVSRKNPPDITYLIKKLGEIR